MAKQKQKTEKIQKETQTMKAIQDAQREKAVLEINIEKQVKYSGPASVEIKSCRGDEALGKDSG